MRLVYNLQIIRPNIFIYNLQLCAPFDSHYTTEIGSFWVKQVRGNMGHFVTFQSIIHRINEKVTIMKRVIGQLQGNTPLNLGIQGKMPPSTGCCHIYEKNQTD